MDKKPKDIVDLVDNTETQFSDLFTRMDEDYEGIWEMSPHAYTSAGKVIETKTQKHGTELEVASNDLRTFCDRVEAKLVSSEMQIRVLMPEQEGQDKRDDIAALERLLHFALERADERLMRLLHPRLKESVVWYGLVRGWLAGRFLVYKNKKNVVFDFMALDPRWLTYEIGGNGLLWVCYKTFKSAGMLKELYDYSYAPWYKVWEKSPTHYPVYDYWEYEREGKISNAVVCKDTFLKKPEVLNIPSMPIIILPIAIRPPIAGAEGVKIRGYGESIFAPDRYINEIRNRFASIVLTWANLKANQPMINYKTAQGRPIEKLIGYPGEVLELTKGENELVASPFPDIPPTVIGELNWLDEQMEQGMMPRISLGSPPASGTAYNLIQEAGDRIYNPQLRSLENFYATACCLIEEQLIAGGIQVKVRGEDKETRKYYEVNVKPVDLKLPHIIKVELTSDAPWRRMDTYQVAQMAKQLGVPQEYINEFILKFPDPKGMDDLAAIELFEHSPKGAMSKAIVALIKRRGVHDAFLAKHLLIDLDRLEKAEARAAGEIPTVSQERPPVMPPEGETPLSPEVPTSPVPLGETPPTLEREPELGV